MSRFFSTLIIITLAAAGAVVIAVLLLKGIGGSYLDQSSLMVTVAGLVVEVAAFTGMFFLLCRVFRSTGALLGAAIAIIVVLEFLWSVVVYSVIFVLGDTPGSSTVIQATLLSDYFNPGQFLTILITYESQSYSGTPIQSSAYGISLPLIILDGLIWVLVPFLSFMWLAVTKD